MIEVSVSDSIKMLPDIWSFVDGDVVPIPTLPSVVKERFSCPLAPSKVIPPAAPYIFEPTAPPTVPLSVTILTPLSPLLLLNSNVLFIELAINKALSVPLPPFPKYTS